MVYYKDIYQQSYLNWDNPKIFIAAQCDLLDSWDLENAVSNFIYLYIYIYFNFYISNKHTTMFTAESSVTRWGLKNKGSIEMQGFSEVWL